MKEEQLEQKEQLPYILVRIADNIYALSCERVISTSLLKEITPVPRPPLGVRGVIKFREQIIPFVGLRRLFNFKSVEQEIQEFYDLMEARKQDHINWVTTLEDCVNRNIKFTLTTDPHACAFGKWYDVYDPNNSNLMFIITFARFNTPHMNIHEIGVQVNNLMLEGKFEEAKKTIKATKDTDLKQMMHLFDDIKEAFKESKREISIILGDGQNNICVSADEIVSIEHLTPADEDWIGGSMINSEYVEGIFKRKDGSPVFLMNDRQLIKTYAGAVR